MRTFLVSVSLLFGVLPLAAQPMGGSTANAVSVCDSAVSLSMCDSADMMLVCDSTADIPADSLFPVKDSSEVKLQATIEMKKGYLSGICILSHQGDSIRGALFNEFGITAMDFCYDLRKDEVTLTSVMAMLDKWYVRPVLRKDLLEVLHALRDGKTTYADDKYGIKFTFLPLIDNETEDETEEQPF